MSTTSLFLSHRLPFPPNKGDKIRSHALLKHLAARGPVHVGCFIDDPQDLQYQNEVRKVAGGECWFESIGSATKWRRIAEAIMTAQPITTATFASSDLSRWVENIIADKELEDIIVFGSAMAPYLFNNRTACHRALFDMVDVDSDKWLQYSKASSGLFRWIYEREARAVGALEREAVLAFGKTLLVSPFEVETFRQMVPECAGKIASLNNGVDLEEFSPGLYSNPFPQDQTAIVMTGHMDYRPNSDGALWFAEAVAPLIFSELPAAHVYFVGSNPPSVLRKKCGPKITVTGRVEDVRPYIAGAAAVVAPLLIARGVQNKVLEALAMKKPVVATQEATRALDVKAGVHLWIENDPKRFAEAVVAAVQSPQRNEIAARGRTYVEQNHDWAAILSALDLELSQLAGKTARTTPGTNQLTPASMRPVTSKVTGAKA